jgi:hypothetical protein
MLLFLVALFLKPIIRDNLSTIEKCNSLKYLNQPATKLVKQLLLSYLRNTVNILCI